MEKLNPMKNEISLAALFLAGCVFIDTTAFGYFQLNQLKKAQRIVHAISTLSEGSEFSVPRQNTVNNKILQIPDGGPDQPEVQQFTPIGTSDMVDPFTGDFSYNIPLLDVDGYPINISYNAGVTMDQEASWVGLGWSLNPGVVNRVLRGLPDDFNGSDEIQKEMNLEKNWTIGTSVDMDAEFFGLNTQSFNLGTLSQGLSYNNYNGFSSYVSMGPTFSLGNLMGAGNESCFSLGISGNSSSGATISPSFSSKEMNGEIMESKMSIGTELNSRQGLQQFSSMYVRRTEAMKNSKKSTSNTQKKIGPISILLPISSVYNFAQPTYTPQFSMPFNSIGGTYSYKMGPDFFGSDAHIAFKGYYHVQWLRYKQLNVPSYGYMNLHSAQGKSNAMLDFNRENDGPFTKNTPALPIANLTYDIFSVSGQGIAGSYRPVRREIGHVFDPSMNNGSVNYSAGLETGMGGTFKAGVDVSLTYTNSNSGDWKDLGNPAYNDIKYKDNDWYFREANELAVASDTSHFNNIGGGNPTHFLVNSHRSIEKKLTDMTENVYSTNNYSKQGKEKRNQVMSMLTNGELKQGLGIEPLHPLSYAWTNNKQDHHIGQFTVLNVEGIRYVYGIAAYSHFQEDVSFNVGSTIFSGPNPVDFTKNLVKYEVNSDNTINNQRGIDHYFNKVITPAYAHSYLLTTVLNADYVDADQIKGPSKGDLGGYLKIDYTKIDNFHWRNPVNQSQAAFDEGLNTDNSDDKGHYIHGEKELWYVKSIKSKNHIAVFYTSSRDDAMGIIDENGGLLANSSQIRMQKLDKIELYSIADYEADSLNAVPLKTVHFEYEYALCPNFDGNINQEGKLTLTKIYFTYQNSNKGKYTPYEFNYGEKFNQDGSVSEIVNPEYNPKEIDRWNNYKKQDSFNGDISNDPLRPSDFPYVGLDKQSADRNVIAWNLTTIDLPSGGKIQIDYESDDYAYVQHKRANQMLKIIGVQDVSNSNEDIAFSNTTNSISSLLEPNGFICVELYPDPNSPSGYNENIEEYVQPGQQIYFRVMMKFANNEFDFVPGYANISSQPSDLQIVNVGGQPALRIKFKGMKLVDNGLPVYNPIAVSAIQFARIHLSKFIPPSSITPVNENANLPGLIESMAGSYLSLLETFVGPNIPLWAFDIGTKIVLNHSWVRLQNPNKEKLGGGHRVKQIRMYDSWKTMTHGQMASQFYGQDYFYKLEDSTSSGVASYEPQIGNDENPWRQPVFANTEFLLAPDIRNYQETPFGEQFFPTPIVGYSRVMVQAIKRDGVLRTATGNVVHEFYTAKDFPTIVKRTIVDKERIKLNLYTVFFNSIIDELAVSQGFVVENNNMHGKPKSQAVYAQNQSSPISKVEYKYLSEPMIVNTSFIGLNSTAQVGNQLTNSVTTIHKDGKVDQQNVGLTYEAVADFRKSTNNTISGSMDLNINYTAPYLLVPTIMAMGSFERTAFRSATMTKVIERFGILEKTISTDLGSVVEVKNLAYDAETGTVLLTETTTNFNDKVYSFIYPAHWYYNQMGLADRNIGLEAKNVQFTNGGTSQLNNQQFSKGDEIAFITFGSNEYTLGWVTDASESGIVVLLKNGTPLNGLVKQMKILRSGHRNLQTTPIGTLVVRDNPLDNLEGNVFEKVLQASAIEYNDEWKTFCECFLDNETEIYSTNPYVLGTRGTWRPMASYVHLSDRSQTNENGNSNIRVDGMFTSFNPFYKLTGANWNIDRQNWTYTSSVVEFSPFGQALETIDALNRYSSSLYGYNQSLPVAVAVNTRYRQLGFDGFEDYDFKNCSDNHFKIAENSQVISYESHTGRKSLKVNSGSSVVFSKTFSQACESSPCDLSTKIESSNVDKVNMTQTSILTVHGGTLPYSIDYQIIEGNPVIDLNDNGQGITIEHTITGNPISTKVRIIITDSNGCQYITEI